MKTILLSNIDATDRLRPVSEDWAGAIAASIEQHGLEQPIVVRPEGEGYVLVSGGHRFAAMTMLGWSELTIGQQVIIRKLSASEARLAEIDENLIRHELSALDRALFLAERKRVYLEIYPETANGGDRKSKVQRLKEEISSPSWRLDLAERFTTEAAEKIGLSERTIQRAISLADQLSPEAIRLMRGTSLERNQAALQALAAEEHDSQIAIVGFMASGEAESFSKARELAGLTHETVRDEQARILAQFMALWAKAGPRNRAAIREHVNGKGSK